MTPARLEDLIISAIYGDKQFFRFMNTSWDLRGDKKYLIETLNISLKQIRSNLYYGCYSKATIEDAIIRLTAA